MCIIAYSPKGTDIPSHETLLNCWRKNPDGAGYMYVDSRKNKVVTRKGFMNFGEFFEDIQETIGSGNDMPVVIHFRIGTHGHNSPQMTHPFPVSTKHDLLVALRSYSDVAIAHNGIISLTGHDTYDYVKDDKTGSYRKVSSGNSDTYYFVRDYASLIIGDDVRYYRDKNNLALLDKLADSKLCILSADGNVSLIGRFNKCSEDGCFYSNDSYKHSLYTMTGSGYSHGGSWMSDDEFDDGSIDYLWQKYGSEDKQQPKMLAEGDFKQVSASFVPTQYYILEDTWGIWHETDDDLYVYDSDGNVYTYDNELDLLIMIKNALVVDSVGDPQTPRENELMMFRDSGISCSSEDVWGFDRNMPF